MNYFVLRFDHSYRKEDILALSKLSGRVLRKWSRRILSLLGYGVGIFAVLTGILKEVADLMGISQSYISRLEKRIIVRLRKEIIKMS